MEPKGSATHSAIGRLAFLDGVRAVAALTVMAQHILELGFPAYRHWSDSTLNLGQTGVSAFFLVSGFIIPFSLERVNNLKRFWIGRFFRLYPLYWATLIVGTAFLVAVHAGRGPGEVGTYVRTLPDSFLVNATMLQPYTHYVNAIGAYWTLAVELTFYGLCSLLFLFKLNRQTFWIVLCFSAFFVAHILRDHGHAVFYGSRVARMGTFFVGTLVYRYWSGTTSKRMMGLGTALFVVPALLWPFAALLRGGTPSDPATLSVISGNLAGYAVFAGFFLVRNITFPAWLTKAGEISYSVYLIHATLLLTAVPFGHKIGCATTALLTIPLSILCYHRVEAPAMKFGRELLKRKAASREPVKTAEAAP